MAAWLNGEYITTVLADLFDLYLAAHTPRGVSPKRYKRPTPTEKTSRHIGADPIPVSEFEAWYYNQ